MNSMVQQCVSDKILICDLNKISVVRDFIANTADDKNE